MKFISFNNEKISKLALGTAQLGIKYGIANKNDIPTQKQTQEIINYARDSKINLFDTANAYGNSEYKLGKSLENKEAFIVSKISSKEFCKKNIDNILKNTQQKCLFALLLHDKKLLLKWGNKEEEILSYFKKNKKIKYFGISIYSQLEFNLAIKSDFIDCIEIPFNIFDQRAVKNKWIQIAKEHNKLLIIRSVFLQGLLLMEKDNKKCEFAKMHLDTFSKISQELNISKIKLALFFVDIQAPDSIVLFGCDNISQTRQTIQQYNDISSLSKDIIPVLEKTFAEIKPDIYNPTQWNIK